MASLTPSFFQTILKIEGGYQKMPSDNGNYCNGQLVGTKYGMSAGAVGTWLGRCLSEQEMRNLTKSDAQAFYAWYFDRYNLFQIQSQQFFELLANNTMGNPASAAKVAQREINKLGYNVSVDGVFGPQTIGALNDAWIKHGATLYNAIRNAWIDFYISLNRPEWIEGWLKRMEHFPLLDTDNTPTTTTGKTGLALLLVFAGFLIFKKRA